jgi:hypothetical protein
MASSTVPSKGKLSKLLVKISQNWAKQLPEMSAVLVTLRENATQVKPDREQVVPLIDEAIEILARSSTIEQFRKDVAKAEL